MEDNKKSELRKEFLSLVKILINGYCSCEDNRYKNDSIDQTRINEIVDYAAELTIKVYNKFPNPDEEIYSGDILILKIDDNPPHRFWITRHPEKKKPGDVVTDMRDNDVLIGKFDIISDYSKLGKELLGRHAGDEFRFSDDEEKNERTIKVLQVLRTNGSLRITREEIEADEYFDKTHQK